MFFLLFVGFFSPQFFIFRRLEFFDSTIFSRTPLLVTTLLQAFFSMLATLLCALISAWGLLNLRARVSPSLLIAIEYLMVLPSFFPPLIVIVSVLSFIPFFPFGFAGVVLMHVFFEVGFVAVFLSRWFAKKMAPYNDLFKLQNKTIFSQWRILGPLLKRDVFMISGFLFVFFMTSLSVPMILSGGSYTSLEHAMYSALKNSEDWNTALHFFFAQILCVSPFFLFLPGMMTQEEDFQGADTTVESRGTALAWIALFPSVCVLLGLFSQALPGFRAIQRENLLFKETVIGSLLVGFLASGFAFLFLSIVSYFYQHRPFRFWLQLLTVPSFVMLSFSIVSCQSFPSALSVVLLCVLLAVVTLPTVSKLGVYQQIEKLDEQIEMAALLGANRWKTYSVVIFPQTLPWISFLSGLTGVWALGDFAITRLFLSEDRTVGLKIQSLVEQYRWDQAVYLSWFLLLSGLIVFFFFGGLAYVASEKLK